MQEAATRTDAFHRDPGGAKLHTLLGDVLRRKKRIRLRGGVMGTVCCMLFTVKVMEVVDERNACCTFSGL